MKVKALEIMIDGKGYNREMGAEFEAEMDWAIAFSDKDKNPHGRAVVELLEPVEVEQEPPKKPTKPKK